MQTFIRYAQALCLSFLMVIGMTAQEESPFQTPISFSSLSMDKGLSSNTVRALLQDRKGFVWMGTSRGLNRYDGRRVTVLHGTRALSVTSLVEWGDTLWVGTSDGLFLYQQRADSVQRYELNVDKTSNSDLNVADMKMDAAGNLWVTTMGQGILCLNCTTGHARSVPTPNDDKSYGCIYVTRGGTIWASSNWVSSKLVRYHAGTKRFEPVHLQVGEVSGIAMSEDSDGWMWLGAWNGSLVRFDKTGGKAEYVFTSEETHIQYVHSIMEVKPGDLLVGSDKGLALVDVKNHRVRLHGRDALNDSFIYPLMRDREGGTWIGTYYGGVNYTHPVLGNFSSYTHETHANSVSGNVVNHFCEDAEHRLWIASDDGGLCYYRPEEGVFVKVDLGDGAAEHNVHALRMEGENLYAGTYSQGLYVVNTKTLQVTHVPAFIDENGRYFDVSSYAICSDRKHRVWVGTYKEVAIYHPETRTFSDVKNVGTPVMAMREDHAGNMWVATDGNGIWRCDARGTWKHYYNYQERKHVTDERMGVYSLYEDGAGTLWVGSASGLLRYQRKADRFERVNLLPEPVGVYGVTAVEGHLWLTTSAGILSYSLERGEVERVYQGGGNISSTDFLPDAIYRGYDGKVYLGTTNGFVSFMPQLMHRNEVRPQVVFTSLEVFGRPVAVGSEILPVRLPYADELRLSYRENVFRIYFSAMSYLQPSDIQYSYYLEGFDEDWIEGGNQQSVNYTNLSPGTYVLHVRAMTNDGVLSEESTLRIVITPPFYWNTPAKILYLLLFFAAAFFFVRHLLRKKERKHVAEIKELNIQKEQEIQEINIQKEQEIQELNEQKEQEVHDARIKFMTINDKDQELLKKMEAVIEQNFSNSDLSVDFIASEIGVSRSGLFAKMKALADITPNEMIQIVRLKHAASLLLEGRYRVNEVCYMVGFSSPSYFAKCFQKQYGCTPAKYKG